MERLWVNLRWLTAENAETDTEHERVTEVETDLEEARHLGLHVIVVDRVEVHVKRGGGRGPERRPLPVIILSIQQEVRCHNRHTHRHYGQNDENQQHESVDIVYLPQPEKKPSTQLCQTPCLGTQRKPNH